MSSNKRPSILLPKRFLAGEPFESAGPKGPLFCPVGTGLPLDILKNFDIITYRRISI